MEGGLKMAFRYTITDYKCPSCGKSLKRDSEGLWTILVLITLVATLGTVLLWFLSIKIIDSVYTHVGCQLGDKIIECPRCGRRVCLSKGNEWIELHDTQKKCWALRKVYYAALILSGFPLIGLLGQLSWLSTHPGDHDVAKFLLVLFFITTLIEIFLCLYLEKAVARDYIEVSESDFDKISESMKLTRSSFENETILIKVKGHKHE